MIVNKINEFLSSEEKTVNDWLAYETGKLAEFSFKRQFGENKESDNSLRLSNAGKCPRQLAYKFHNFELKGKEIDGRAKIIFFQGDVVELLIVQLAKSAGCPITATGLNQMTVSVKIAETEVKGHPDGVLFDGEVYLVEVKSMSDYGFKAFEKGELEESYIAQVNMYMDALGLGKCIVIGLNKNNGVLHEVIVEKNTELVKKLKETLGLVLKSTPDTLPDPAYAVNDKGVYPWQCLYCAWWCVCRPNAEKVLVGRAYKLKEKPDLEKSLQEASDENVKDVKLDKLFDEREPGEEG